MNRSIRLIFAFVVFPIFAFAQGNGCLMTEMTVTKLERPISKIIFEFDKFDNPISRETIQYFDGTEASSKVLYEYNAKNKPVKTQYFFKNKLTRTVNSEYDNAGNLLSESESKENKVSNRSVKVDNKLEQVFLNEDGSVAAKHVSEKNPNMQVFTKYDAQNNITSTEKKILSTSGKVVENQFDDVLGHVKKTEKITYDGNDKMTRSENYINGILQNYSVYEYTDNHLSKITVFTKNNLEDYRLEFKYSGSNQTETYNYYRNELANRSIKEYDTRGNCVKETSFRADGQIINVTTYKFTCKK
ncbi:MAG TPA: hypothetical protein VK175_12275 [Leadbetterella sp.]|nr:hypothetical protein [Leadbetterella sp.]